MVLKKLKSQLCFISGFKKISTLKKPEKSFAHSVPCGKEFIFLKKVIKSGQLAGDGKFGKRCEEVLEKIFNVPRVLLVPSCTHALEMAAILLNLKEGDEIIIPSFTFVSTANAFVLRGAKPIFVDIRKDTFNIDEKKLPLAFSNKTKGVVVVHYGGVGCAMNIICKEARKRCVPIIEDNAHGLFGKMNGKWLGTYGDFSTCSFHQTKNLSCGEGGALFINNKKYIKRAEIIREKGTNRKSFLRGKSNKYKWISLGSSYLLSELCSSFLLGQILNWKKIQRIRKRLWIEYHKGLVPWFLKNNLSGPKLIKNNEPAWHTYGFLLPDSFRRANFLKSLEKKNIKAVFHYLPLDASPFIKKNYKNQNPCPVAHNVSKRLVRLPLHLGLKISNVKKIVKIINSIKV